jgi:hypothetical protein
MPVFDHPPLSRAAQVKTCLRQLTADITLYPSSAGAEQVLSWALVR